MTLITVIGMYDGGLEKYRKDWVMKSVQRNKILEEFAPQSGQVPRANGRSPPRGLKIFL